MRHHVHGIERAVIERVRGALDHRQRRRHVRGQQLVEEVDARRGQHGGVGRAVDEDRRREIGADVRGGRRGLDSLRCGAAFAEQAARDLRTRERINADACVDFRADARRADAAVELRLVVRAGRHQREHAAGGIPRYRDTVRLDSEPRCVGARPANRALHVMKLRRPQALALEPVVRRDARVAEGAEGLGVVDDVARVLVAAEEAAAEQMDDGHALRRDAFRRMVDVERHVHVAALAEDDVLLGSEVADIRRRRLSSCRNDRCEHRRRSERTRCLDESAPRDFCHCSSPLGGSCGNHTRSPLAALARQGASKPNFSGKKPRP